MLFTQIVLRCLDFNQFQFSLTFMKYIKNEWYIQEVIKCKMHLLNKSVKLIVIYYAAFDIE